MRLFSWWFFLGGNAGELTRAFGGRPQIAGRARFDLSPRQLPTHVARQSLHHLRAKQFFETHRVIVVAETPAKSAGVIVSYEALLWEKLVQLRADWEREGA